MRDARMQTQKKWVRTYFVCLLACLLVSLAPNNTQVLIPAPIALNISTLLYESSVAYASPVMQLQLLLLLCCIVAIR